MYTVYKITNIANEKYYIGVHKTSNIDDNYMGSGVAIKNAIKKYGKENFNKEILLVTENKDEAYSLEKKLTIDFNTNQNYNMKIGGVGGWSKEAASNGGLKSRNQSEAGKKSYEMKVGIHSLTTEEIKQAGKLGGLANRGKAKSDEHRAKLSASLKGKKYKPRRPS